MSALIYVVRVATIARNVGLLKMTAGSLWAAMGAIVGIIRSVCPCQLHHQTNGFALAARSLLKLWQSDNV